MTLPVRLYNSFALHASHWVLIHAMADSKPDSPTRNSPRRGLSRHSLDKACLLHRLVIMQQLPASSTLPSPTLSGEGFEGPSIEGCLLSLDAFTRAASLYCSLHGPQSIAISLPTFAFHLPVRLDPFALTSGLECSYPSATAETTEDRLSLVWMRLRARQLLSPRF